MKIDYNKYINARKFEQWKINSLKLSKVIDISEYKELPAQLKDYLAKSSPRERDCYNTAFQCVLNCSNVSFILGYGISSYGQICDHAWNQFNNVEFDLMKQLGVQYRTYYKIIELSKEEIVNYMLSGAELMDYAILESYYRENITAENDYVSTPEDPVLTLHEVIREKEKLIKKR